MTDRDASALVVVDMQNDFLAQGGYYGEKAKLARARNGALNQADVDALARLYQHPPASCVIRDGYQDFVARVTAVAAMALAHQMPTIFVQAAYDPMSFYKPPLFIAEPERRDYGCHPGTWGAAFVDPIKPLTLDQHAKVIEKHTFDAFFETELRGFLHFHQINTLYVSGMETNVCVLCTALSALSNGFTTIILEDGVTTSQPELQAPTLQIIEVAKGQRMSTQSFLALLKRQNEQVTIPAQAAKGKSP
ncbi:cysteine hydrolase family protein [Candidatus Entotheonella palauensis]|uniref:cysteine hydrolase family protein n=1 Tax=Candidatus Entotheonella palauensis TaxID=93172 RepID=UPI000B7DD368|nr:isochorismatase family cysteine hydrolase [Candidatus Entotheonella palauensis]